MRTYHLLRPHDRRRIWIASVAPGYDDTRVRNRDTHIVVDRAAGRVYDEQWAAAIDNGADWVIVTSWNEWFENIEIEPGRRFGNVYLNRTRFWIATFKGEPLRRVR